MGTSNSLGTYKPGKPSIDLPPNILRIGCAKVEKLYINQAALLEFKVEGVNKKDIGGSYKVKLVPSDSNILLFDSKKQTKYEFEVEKGWKFSVYVGGSKIVENAKIDVEIEGIKNLSFPISILQDKDVFSREDVKRLLDDYKESRIFNISGNVVGNGYCINSADKGIGALLNDTKNFYTEPNLKSQGGNGVRLKDASSRALVINQLGYMKESFIIITDKFNTDEEPTKLNESLKWKLEKSINNRIGNHIYYFTMHGEYHVMTLYINYNNPCNVKFSILDQGYVNNENVDFDKIDDELLMLEKRFWKNKPHHSKDIKLWKIQKK